MQIDTTRFIGYASLLSIPAGESLSFHVHSPEASTHVSVVRFRCADADATGPGLKYDVIATNLADAYACREQQTWPGSAVIVERDAAFVPAGAWSFGCYAWPTRMTEAPQTLMGAWCDTNVSGYALELSEAGGLALRIGSADGSAPIVIQTGIPLEAREWYWLSASFDPVSGSIALFQHRLAAGTVMGQSIERRFHRPGAWQLDAQVPFVIAARCADQVDPKHLAGHFDGKIDGPRVYAGWLEGEALAALQADTRIGNADGFLVAWWDFSIGISSLAITDRSANQHQGQLHQLARRGVTGVNWTGAVHDFRLAPGEYGAIHFHSDDLYDCGWDALMSLDIPDTWRSGAYGLRLRLVEEAHHPNDLVSVESFIPFFVTPAKHAKRARLAVVAPLVTYLAYANSALRLYAVHFEGLLEHLLQLSQDDVYLHEHPELAQSTYDCHIDGSGRSYSSWLRPIFNLKPRGTPANFVIDSHFFDWLEEKGIDYDLVTDIDLDRDGVRAIDPYAVVCTLSHPEYYSANMMKAVMAFQNKGGRHICLGANSFYWRCEFHREAPAALEVRRGMCGTRTWESDPGEVHLAATGEPGALWRHSGFAPQRLVGVGFSAMVYDHAGYYMRTEQSRDPRVAFIVDGIPENERVGDYAVRVGGAVGIEIDRYDRQLGSPGHAIIVATSYGLGPGALPTPEEFRTTVHGLEGDQNTLVRADMVFFETANGGAVFATGSISYVLALTCNGYVNDISRLTENVLRRFLDPQPFDMPSNRIGFSNEG